MNIEIDIPTWFDCNEKLENINRSNRTIEQALLNGSELTPLEVLVHNYDDADANRSEAFMAELKTLVEWCINRPRQVVSNHEEL
jgi:hypothetical protein